MVFSLFNEFQKCSINTLEIGYCKKNYLDTRRLRDFAITCLRIQCVKSSPDFCFAFSLILAVLAHGKKLYLILHLIDKGDKKEKENHVDGFVLQSMLFTIW